MKILKQSEILNLSGWICSCYTSIMDDLSYILIFDPSTNVDSISSCYKKCCNSYSGYKLVSNYYIADEDSLDNGFVLHLRKSKKFVTPLPKRYMCIK